MKFSIVTPTYNRAHTITNTIDSVLGQSYSNWEMVIIDDGSTDNTEETIKKYTKDERIKYYKLDKNVGVCGAKNQGIKFVSADSDWITILDSDDSLVEDSLKRMVDKISEFSDFKYFMFTAILDDGSPYGTIPRDNYIGDLYTALGKDNAVNGKFQRVFHISTRNLFKFHEELSGYEFIGWNDLARVEKTLYTTSVTQNYNMNEEGLTRPSKMERKDYMNINRAMKLIFKKFGSEIKKANIKRYALYLSVLANSDLQLRHFKEGLKNNLKCFLYNPLEPRIYRNILIFVQRIFAPLKD